MNYYNYLCQKKSPASDAYLKEKITRVRTAYLYVYNLQQQRISAFLPQRYVMKQCTIYQHVTLMTSYPAFGYFAVFIQVRFQTFLAISQNSGRDGC